MQLPLTDPDTLFEELLQDLPPETAHMGYVRSTCNFSHRVNVYDGWRTRFTISPTIDRLTRPPKV
jgi:hypothetical protein